MTDKTASNFLITNGEVKDEENALENSDIEVKVI